MQLSGEVSRMALAIEPYCLQHGYNREHTSDQPIPPIDVSKPSTHDAVISYSMMFLHAPKPESKLHATPWQSPILIITAILTQSLCKCMR